MKLRLMAVVCVFVIISGPVFGASEILKFGLEKIIQAGDPPADIAVTGYSVPSYVDWNNDSNDDLIIGEGPISSTVGKVQVYLNTGTNSQPQFSGYFYAQSNGADLTCTATGCLGCFPRVVYWNADDKKDLLIGMANGLVRIYLNTGTDENPTFDAGAYLQVGAAGSKVNIDVGDRATPSVVDWDEDGKRDLVVGGLDGKIHIFINSGTDTAPNYLAQTFAQNNGSDLTVSTQRSCPEVIDMNDDGKKDILTGDTSGRLLFYHNVGSNEAPSFSGYTLAESNAVTIDLAGTPRSRQFVCDWNGDEYLDVLVGSVDGKVRLYEGKPVGDFDLDGDVDMSDFAILGNAWRTSQGGANWDVRCDIDVPKDNVIDEKDLKAFTEHWLAGK